MEQTVDSISVKELESLFARQKDELGKAVEARLADWGSGFKAAYRVDKGEEKPAEVEKAADVAELSDNTVSRTVNKVTGFEVWGIPVGAAVAGGFVAIFATELVDGYLKNQSVMIRGAVKLVAGGAIAKFGPKYLGKEIAYPVALLMAFDALKNDLMPSIFGYATTWANQLTGTVTTAGLGWTGGPAKTGNQTIAPTPAKTGDYYSASGLG